MYGDFQRYYSLDLAVLVRDSPPQRMLLLIRQLPLESRTVAKLRGGEQFDGWGIDRYLTAQLIDAVNGVNHSVVAANSKKKPKAPKPVPRPNKTPKKEDNEFRRRMNAKIGRGG